MLHISAYRLGTLLWQSGRRSRWAPVVSAALLLGLAETRAAQADEPDSTKLALASTRFGVTFFAGLASEFDAATKPAPAFASLAPEDAKRDIQALAEAYKARMDAA